MISVRETTMAWRQEKWGGGVDSEQSSLTKKVTLNKDLRK